MELSLTPSSLLVRSIHPHRYWLGSGIASRLTLSWYWLAARSWVTAHSHGQKLYYQSSCSCGATSSIGQLGDDGYRCGL